MDKKLCKTCKYWQLEEGYADNLMAPCLASRSDHNGDGLLYGMRMVAKADDDGSAVLVTTGEFGCVEWM